MTARVKITVDFVPEGYGLRVDHLSHTEHGGIAVTPLAYLHEAGMSHEAHLWDGQDVRVVEYKKPHETATVEPIELVEAERPE